MQCFYYSSFRFIFHFSLICCWYCEIWRKKYQVEIGNYFWIHWKTMCKISMEMFFIKIKIWSCFLVTKKSCFWSCTSEWINVEFTCFVSLSRRESALQYITPPSLSLYNGTLKSFLVEATSYTLRTTNHNTGTTLGRERKEKVIWSVYVQRVIFSLFRPSKECRTSAFPNSVTHIPNIRFRRRADFSHIEDREHLLMELNKDKQTASDLHGSFTEGNHVTLNTTYRLQEGRWVVSLAAWFWLLCDIR